MCKQICHIGHSGNHNKGASQSHFSQRDDMKLINQMYLVSCQD
uniref:Uncharacterized protein n=2 Tax=Anguilla anguilla TaxID=7936 RepID=A0A0E9RVY1_ANGAN